LRWWEGWRRQSTRSSEGASRGRWAPSDHVFANGSLGDGNFQFLEFPVNARSAPQRVGVVYLSDEGNDVRGNSAPAGFARTTLPPPKEAKTCSMLLDDRVRLEQSKRYLPSIPGVGEPDPSARSSDVRRGRLEPRFRTSSW